MTFASGIKDVRERCLLSQDAFAKELGVAFSTVNRWENGKAVPNYIKMRRITRFCEGHGIEWQELNDAWKESRNVDTH